MNDPQFEKYRPLLMGLMDGELRPDEAAEVNDALTRSSALRDEYERLREADKALNAVSFIEPADAVARSLWKSPYHRFARQSGVLFLAGGYGLLLLDALYRFAVSDEPVLPRFATGAILIGIVMLVITFAAERASAYKADPYKDIER